ncbi:MAG: sulfatase-like hydrolase/transferase [Xanthomonadales bacterium]|nr:sulfatase-like hydrolase/transferase [Xanthomonadales bacterium]
MHETLLLPVLVFLLLPAYFVHQSDELALDQPRVLLVWSILALAGCVFTLILAGMARLCGASAAYVLAIRFACYFVIFSGFFFPVASTISISDPQQMEVNFPNLVICYVLAGTVVLALRYKFTWVQDILLLLVLFNAAYVGWGLYESHRSIPPRASLYSLSSEKNIVVLSFDGLTRAATNSILRNDPLLGEAFSGFTIFANVASSSPTTDASTLTSLLGNRNYRDVASTESELWRLEPELLSTNLALDSGFETTTFGIYGRGFNRAERAHSISSVTHDTMIHILNHSLSRTLTPYMTLRDDHSMALARVFRTALFVGVSEERETLSQSINRSRAPEWKKLEMRSLFDWLDYMDALEADSDRPVAQFLHFSFTHFPVELDQQCQFRGADPGWIEANQNWNGVLAETHCALNMMARYVEHLEFLGVLDKTLLILKSDHGKPVGYYPPGSYYDRSIQDHERWGVGRYAPFLAIRRPGTASSGITWDERPAILDDLARTICLQLKTATFCDAYPGSDLLSPPGGTLMDDWVTVFVVKDSRSSYKFVDHVPLTVQRGRDIVRQIYTRTH